MQGVRPPPALLRRQGNKESSIYSRQDKAHMN